MSGHPDCSHADGPNLNTDRYLWPEVSVEENAPRLFVTAGGGIGIDVGGHVIVKPLRDWHALALAAPPSEINRTEITEAGWNCT